MKLHLEWCAVYFPLNFHTQSFKFSLTQFCYTNYRSTMGVLEITILIVSEVFEIPIVTDSDSIGHPCG